MKIRHTIIILISAWVAALSLTGCGVYKKYEREDLFFVDSLYRRLPDISDTTSIASLSWSEFFTDPILQEWIRLGIEHNTDYSIARLRVEQAQATLQAAKQAIFPSASLLSAQEHTIPAIRISDIA